jgi:hypothetical protein
MIKAQIKKYIGYIWHEIYQTHDFIGGCFFDSGHGIFSAFIAPYQCAFCQASFPSTWLAKNEFTLT